MSEDLFYNRDVNLSGFISPENLSEFNLTPSYGSKVQFSSNNISYETDDSYFNTIPSSINNLRASFDIKYDVNEIDAQRLVNFFEARSAIISFEFVPDDFNVYRNLLGFSDNYAINHINDDRYEFAVNIAIDQSPTILNWSNMNFLNYNFRNYELGVQYKKYDIVYIDGNKNKLNNFWYCKKDNLNVLNSSENVFQIITGNFSWTQARDDAERRGGRLAVLNTEEKNNKAPKYTGNAFNYLWIGATDKDLEGDWRWIDGTRVSDSYSNWNAGEPNDSNGEDYASIYVQNMGLAANKWNDLPESHVSVGGYILEIIEGPEWSQEFFFKPDIGLQNDVKLNVKKLEFKNSFPLRVKTKNNIAPIDLNYKFSNISNKQLMCMLHFLENKAGYRRFRHQIPSVYNRPKLFTCPQWTHTWKYHNSNDLEVSLIEDTMGVIPRNT